MQGQDERTAAPPRDGVGTDGTTGKAKEGLKLALVREVAQLFKIHTNSLFPGIGKLQSLEEKANELSSFTVFPPSPKQYLIIDRGKHRKQCSALLQLSHSHHLPEDSLSIAQLLKTPHHL